MNRTEQLAAAFEAVGRRERPDLDEKTRQVVQDLVIEEELNRRAAGGKREPSPDYPAAQAIMTAIRRGDFDGLDADQIEEEVGHFLELQEALSR